MRYRFVHEKTGDAIVLEMTMSELSDRQGDDGRIRHAGRTWSRDYSFSGNGGITECASWPMLSHGAGVNPQDVPAAIEEARKAGVRLDFAKDGRAIFENAAHRKRALKALGMFDKDGYG